MKGLESVLRRYSQVQMGESVGPQAAFDVGHFQEDLRLVVARSDRFLWIWVAALVVLFVLDCLVVWLEMSNPKLIEAIFAATGTGFAVVLVQMRSMWHEKFATETLIALLPALPPSELKAVMFQLLSVVAKKK